MGAGGNVQRVCVLREPSPEPSDGLHGKFSGVRPKARQEQRIPRARNPWCLRQQLTLVLRRPAPVRKLSPRQSPLIRELRLRCNPPDQILRLNQMLRRAASCDPSLRFRARRQQDSQDYASGSYLASDILLAHLNQPFAKDPHPPSPLQPFPPTPAVASSLSSRLYPACDVTKDFRLGLSPGTQMSQPGQSFRSCQRTRLNLSHPWLQSRLCDGNLTLPESAACEDFHTPVTGNGAAGARFPAPLAPNQRKQPIRCAHYPKTPPNYPAVPAVQNQ